MTNFAARPVLLNASALSYIPAAINTNSAIYAVAPESNGKVFISNYPNPAGHACTYVSAADVIYLDK